VLAVDARQVFRPSRITRQGSFGGGPPPKRVCNSRWMTAYRPRRRRRVVAGVASHFLAWGRCRAATLPVLDKFSSWANWCRRATCRRAQAAKTQDLSSRLRNSGGGGAHAP